MSGGTSEKRGCGCSFDRGCPPPCGGGVGGNCRGKVGVLMVKGEARYSAVAVVYVDVH